MRRLIERLPERIMDKFTITLVGHPIDNAEEKVSVGKVGDGESRFPPSRE